jgi:hypothetical protein
MLPLFKTLAPGKTRSSLDGAAGCSGPFRVEEGGRSGRQVVKSSLPTSTVMRKRDSADCSRVQFFLGWWPLFNQEWWGHI